MALLESLNLPLGQPLDNYHLEDCFNKPHSLHSLTGKSGTLVMFTCNHCPYAIAVWPRIIRLHEEFSKSLSFIAINQNINPAYPDDSPDNMKKKIDEWGIRFPYLVDKDQNVARAFKAQCTPDLYLYDSENLLVYHGRIDDNWQDESKVTKQDLKEAMQNLVEGKPVSDEQKPSMGCSIKWLA